MKSCGRLLPLGIGALCVLATVLPVAAQTGSLSGSVTDAQSGQPLPFVQVFIDSLDIEGLTQQNGVYRLTNVPVGTHTLTAARIGFSSMYEQVTVRADQTTAADFPMTESALLLDQIVVTGEAVVSILRDWSRYWILIWIFLTIELIWGSKDATIRRALDRRALGASFAIVLAVVATPPLIDAVRFSYALEGIDLYFWAVDGTWWWVVMFAGVWGAQRVSEKTAHSILKASMAALAGAAIVTLVDLGISPYFDQIEWPEVIRVTIGRSANGAAMGFWIGLHHRLPRPYGLRPRG